MIQLLYRCGRDEEAEKTYEEAKKHSSTIGDSLDSLVGFLDEMMDKENGDQAND